MGAFRIRLFGFCLAFMSSYAVAQDYGLTIMGGYQFGGAFEDSPTAAEVELDSARSFTLLINFPYEADSEYEILVSRQQTSLREGGQFTGDDIFDLDIWYGHIGGIVLVNPRQLEPYISGGVGLTHMTPARAGLGAETRLSLSLGAGLRVPLYKRIALRFDGRGFLTMLNGGGAIFCSSGNCNVHVASDGFAQYAVNAGIEFRF